jgi:hypothetical protein
MIWKIIFYILSFFYKREVKPIERPRSVLRKNNFFYVEEHIKTDFLILEKPKIKRSSSINDLCKKKMKRQKSVP